MLWGPGPLVDAIGWFDTERPLADRFKWTDRLFAVRTSHAGSIDWAKPLDAALRDLALERQAGNWQVIKADFPSDAVRHVRRAAAGEPPTNEPECAAKGPCPACHAETIAGSSFHSVLTCLENGFAEE